MRRSKASSIESAVRQITKLLREHASSEDDLIAKIVIPFFQLLDYGPDSYELKYPVQGYRPNRPGRKPEADCVFFSDGEHSSQTSLIVVETKRDELSYPELQARFYACNLFVPFYICWSDLAFEVWQLQNFRAPVLQGRYRLDAISHRALSDLKELLAPQRIIRFCRENQIKEFDFDDRRRAIETRYLDRLAIDLSSFKVLDLPRVRDLRRQYVDLRLEELNVIPFQAIEEEVREGAHPEGFASTSRDRSITISELLEKVSAIAIIGDPGAGKSTLLRHLCLNNAYSDSRLVPIFISMREIAATGGTIIEAARHQIARYGNTDNPDFLFESALAQGRVLLCADGIDEVDIDEPRDARAAVIGFNADLSDIMARHSGNVVIVTARRESWPICRPLLSQALREFGVTRLSREAARNFIGRWFVDSPQDGEHIIDMLRGKQWPMFATNPLLLTLTCACLPLQGVFPKRVSDLYAQFSTVLLEQWDHARRISDRPAMHDIDPDVVFNILAELALAFHCEHRAAFTREQILIELGKYANLLRQPAQRPRDIFVEITRQHGMLRSWSIDQLYAFPHLSFQAYFAAKALRSRATGYRVVFEHRYDSFWSEAVALYSELGDITELAHLLLAERDTFLASNLFLLGRCWAVGGTVEDAELTKKTISSLAALAQGQIAFLVEQATNELANIAASEARAAMVGIVRSHDGRLGGKPAGRYAVSVFGEAAINEVTEELVQSGYDGYLLENFAFLPRRIAIEKLQALILRTDWVKKKDHGGDPGIRHLRRDAQRLMAKVGEDIAIVPLTQLIDAPELTDFEKAGSVAALASIDHESIPGLLRSIVGGDAPMDCRIEAAGNLGPDDPDARQFLLKLVEDERCDYYDRRDAAHRLEKFNLRDDDLDAFRSLIFDPDPEFYGGPMLAVGTVGKLKTNASRRLLQEAQEFWRTCAHPEARRVYNEIMQELNLEDDSADLHDILERAIDDRYVNWKVPQVASEYFRRTPAVANEFFVTALRSYNREYLYGGTLASAILTILQQISLTDVLLEAAIDLVKRTPKDSGSWALLAQVWQRRDLSPTQRALFRS